MNRHQLDMRERIYIASIKKFASRPTLEIKSAYIRGEITFKQVVQSMRKV